MSKNNGKDRPYAVRVARERGNGGSDFKTVIINGRSPRDASRKVRSPGRIMWARKVQVEDLFDLESANSVSGRRKLMKRIDARNQ